MRTFWHYSTLLTESKQSIINLGFPSIIASLLYEKFHEKAPLIARWFKEQTSKDDAKDWWLWRFGGFSTKHTLNDYIKLYDSTFDHEKYIKALKDLNMSHYQSEDESDRLEMRRALRKEIDKKFFDEVFFYYYPIISAIESGTLKDLAPYKNLPFSDAARKFEEKRLLSDSTPVKKYKNGFKWIDVGKKCPLVGEELRNCGSVGVMSMDPSATMIALFGPENKPHVVVTYSPSEKRISGDQGGASTEVKSKYHRYVLDLVKTLGAKFDHFNSKSSLLGLKYQLQNKAQKIQQINRGPYDIVFRFVLGGHTYYTDQYTSAPEEEWDRVQAAVAKKEITLPTNTGKVTDLFNHRNRENLRNWGVRYIPLEKLLSGH